MSWLAVSVLETGAEESAPSLAEPRFATIDEAIAKGDIEDVRRHIAKDPESARKGGKTNSRPPLEQAVLRNKQEIAVLLLESGANPNTVNASKRTPLHLAVERKNAVVAKSLLEAGAEPDARDQAGWTPLHHAAAKDLVAVAKALLDGGADPTVLSELGGTPLHEAAASGGAEIIQLLLDTKKIDPKLKSKEGVTALDIAKKFKNQPAIGILSEL